MSKETGPSAAERVSVARACYGGLLLVVPGRMISLGSGHPAGSRAAMVARVLGARHLVQAALTAGPAAESFPPGAQRPGTVLLAGAAVDAVHAASMIGLAGLCPPYRRAVAADILAEAGLVAFGIIAARGLSAR